MPVRSLHSSKIVWPTEDEVISSVKLFAKKVRSDFSQVIDIYLIGSYANQNAGVGSDIDLIIIVKNITEKKKLYLELPTEKLILSADVQVFSENDWLKMKGSRFYREASLHGIKV